MLILMAVVGIALLFTPYPDYGLLILFVAGGLYAFGQKAEQAEIDRDVSLTRVVNGFSLFWLLVVIVAGLLLLGHMLAGQP